MRSGDKCTQSGCNGTMDVNCSRRRGESQIRYLRCSTCGHRAKQVVPADDPSFAFRYPSPTISIWSVKDNLHIGIDYSAANLNKTPGMG